MSSEKRFGYEWNKYSFMNSVYEGQFKGWIYPLTSGDFKGKIVLDAGCGMGRNSYWPLNWGAEKVVSFDYDKRSVEAARKVLSKFSNSEVMFKSIYEIDWRNYFDITFSIGVIHHLNNPSLAIDNLVKSLKPGGVFLAWVYSLEGNEWIVRFVNPIRKYLTSKLPLALVHLLSYFCSVPLWIHIKFFNKKNEYLKQLSDFKFWHIHSIVFDQLIPDVANYWSKKEIAELFNKSELKDLRIIRSQNNCGWTVMGVKK
ncbi:MAG: Methylase involved in ubiquinone/menaquinone biosynthesis [Parcubacteria group bacterium GW2011_GWD2_40_9]|nr:MAG: Methylase involved in ubiquinone/menaquinone biosynthesis [Parcubacteria group bacterium GW2011_GWD2_40_9]